MRAEVVASLMSGARGELVDETALIAALKARKIKAAALDVFSSEPPKSKDLLALDNVVLTPHLGASTEEAEENCAVMVAEQLREYLEHGNVSNSVNFPEVTIPRAEGHRIAAEEIYKALDPDL